MLLKVLKRLAGRGGRPSSDLATLLQQAHDMWLRGDVRSATKLYQQYLELQPSNVEALNGLASCFAEIGRTDQAVKLFELAYSLDDTFIPAMTNRGKLLVDTDRASEAMQFLRRAKICQPDFLHPDAIYASHLLRIGQPRRAREFQLRAWLATFNNLRLANCYLFWTSYDDVDEALIASEHRFWAETVLLPDVGKDPWTDRSGDRAETPPRRRLRIGYLSPDFRSHSVRYFFRPLLDGHDRERVEVTLYHDFPLRDAHTEVMRSAADHFHEVFDRSDAELCALIRSHELDVIVDLASHTSHNRMSLFGHRMATVHLTGLGYPPTTGLRSMDGKVLDGRCITPRSRQYLAEQPVELPTSFWCFDPKEAIPLNEQPPVDRNGHITFACVGNIAKISERVGRAWALILQRVPDSRLLIRSISFMEPLAEQAFSAALADWGLPLERVDLRKPEGGVNFFASYNDLDIVLDTFPFNGGTTTCFAVYMGVPVVSLVGESLVGRMGLSVVTNAGAPELAVGTLDEYVECAVRIAGDRPFLRRFRSEVRERIARNGLGNEKIFAREFEDACFDLVARKQAGAQQWQPQIAALPAREIMRRAYEVLRRGNLEAAQRILEHCLREYPSYGPAHLLSAQKMTWQGEHARALDHLASHLEACPWSEQVGMLLGMVRLELLLGKPEAAAGTLSRLEGREISDVFDAAQAELYRAACSQSGRPGVATADLRLQSVLVLVPCKEAAEFQRVRDACAVADVPPGWTVVFERCAEDDRITAYQATRDRADWDVLLILQKNLVVVARDFHIRVANALAKADVVSYAGASRWARFDWRADTFEVKAGGMLSPSSEKPGWVELHLMGAGRASQLSGMAVLDGGLLAITRDALARAEWDEDLVGCDALLEEAWSYQAGQAGARLAVHRGLGVYVDPAVTLDRSNMAEARMAWADHLAFDPFSTVTDDHIALSVPLEGAPEALRTLDAYLDPP